MNLVWLAFGWTGGFRARNVERRCRRVCVASSRVSELQVGGSAVSEDGIEERGVFPGQLLVEKELGGGGVERTYDIRLAKKFLEDYWQKRPVLFRNALRSFSSPLSPDELAGLACEQDIDSRLIIHWEGLESQHERAKKGSHPSWELRVGPFVESDFQDLPEKCYTLLVQEVNGHIQEVSDLLDHFRFLPNWRLDDVMVSYATEGGGVGPHVDSFDVFLLQAQGRRSWKTSYTPILPEDENLISDCDVRVLKNGFSVSEEWILEPGDMLYVPPRIPHWGVSLDDSCMTFSIGLRAPEKRELVRSFTDYLVENKVSSRKDFVRDNSDDLCEYTVGRDGDDGEGATSDPGILTKEAVREAQRSIREILDLDDNEFARWYARYVTLPKRDALGVGDELNTVVSKSEATGIVAEIASGAGVSLRHREAAVFSYLSSESAGTDGDVLYINGESFPLSPESDGTAKLVCSRKVLQGAALQEQLLEDPGFDKLLVQLICMGLLYCVYDDDS
ncbi:hypothetical protein NDN08_000253 [Rhodosorus marinus]|uniref:Bifunctional lysine-specific demethylase and histidyl-hydroxylase n=1 Tax=Rhodosorus marinus TaxID=101924 RepID=A0AAV8UJW6_9RHOD|nr:hypothetical protein NDN08_000253 [Rhodosorus marinus]